MDAIHNGFHIQMYKLATQKVVKKEKEKERMQEHCLMSLDSGSLFQRLVLSCTMRGLYIIFLVIP